MSEKQQEERSGISKPERMHAITHAWTSTQSAEDFIRALATKDYFLARGDQRGYVVVDIAGEIHSLSRQLKGVKAKELKDRLAVLPPARLPGVIDAQTYAQQVRQQRLNAPELTKVEPGVPTPDERRAALAREQAQRRAVLEKERETLRLRQAQEAGKLAVEHALVNANIIKNRQPRNNLGYLNILSRLPVVSLVVSSVQKVKDRIRERQQKAEFLALSKLHRSERGDVERRLAALKRVQKRETKSLETKLKREEFQRVAGRGKDRNRDGKEMSRPPDKATPILAPEGRLRQAFQKVAPPLQKAGDPPKKQSLKDFFQKASNAFDDAGRERPLANDGQSSQAPRESLRNAFADAAGKRIEMEQTAASRDIEAGELKEQFNKAAGKEDLSPISAANELDDTAQDDLSETFNQASKNTDNAETPQADKEDNEPTRDSLSDRFNRFANQKERGPDHPGREFEKNYRRAPADKSVRR